ncbi:MAG: hypothetical protein HFE71_10170 [Emergencia sp.]|nr:hypothetical protein [Emergencia sp.]
MNISVGSIKFRYIAVISVLLILLGAGFVMRLPFMTETSPEDVDISQIEVDENGKLTFKVEVQESNWFDYSGMECNGFWREDERGQEEKVILCHLHKHFKFGGTDNKKKEFLFEVSDLFDLQDISAVYFGRDNDNILVWKKENY